ncbi:phospholipase A2 inhibitor gamma subunit A1-like [Pelobates fuscus]|uniref:phospholipase A2 inhibitor gamma subunit A1-like n=1 Tax=Pelobates fuscus TaxID=191477 RepID=UPI002FE4A33F
MASVIILLCMLSSLLSTVYSVKCVDCSYRNGVTCENEDNIVDCSDAGCVTISESCLINNYMVPSIKKGCADGITESQVLAVNDKDQLKTTVNIEFCNEELCNKGTPFAYVDNLGEPTEKYCESCYRNNTSDECVSRDRVACRGNQSKCISYIGTLNRADGTTGDYSIKGCVSDLICILKFGSLPGTIEMQEKLFACSEPLTEAIDCSGCE